MVLWLAAFLILLFGGPLAVLAWGPVDLKADWRTARHDSTGLAPRVEEAVVQAYAARAFGWRGAVAVHTWLAVKPPGRSPYVRYEVIGWNVFRGGPAVSVTTGRAPDGLWFNARPRLLRELRGAAAEAVIARLPEAVASYPYPRSYNAWPGPNSNSFMAHVGRMVPELRLALPGNALGKDFLPEYRIFARAPSGTGVQLSLHGLFGILVGWEEGIEINFLGLVLGLNPRYLGIKLPGLGDISLLN